MGSLTFQRRRSFISASTSPLSFSPALKIIEQLQEDVALSDPTERTRRRPFAFRPNMNWLFGKLIEIVQPWFATGRGDCAPPIQKDQ